MAGLALGLLLPYTGQTVGAVFHVSAQPDAVAAFSSQGQASFAIEPVAPADTAAAAPASLMENTPAPDPVATSAVPAPSPDAAAFSILPLGAVRQAAAGRILIYHTHTYEAYEQSGSAYQETEKWRTADAAHNMIRVGEELAQLLRGLGYDVVHDITAFEPPDLTGAYSRSLAMLEQRQAAGESYDLYIDLHRDAYVEGQAGENTVQTGGQRIARLMLLIGKGEGYTGTEYDRKPDWEANLRTARAITAAMNGQLPGLCKDVRLKSGRFNQHVDDCCVLIEVGNNRNTLKEALAAMPYLADAIDSSLRK
jgi:stage II sporulation protein P